MMSKYNSTDFWFKIEPYVYISLANNRILLYNTLDGVFVESDDMQVVDFLKEILKKENCGVILLKYERLKQNNISDFIKFLREKYMCDMIGVDLSKGKPIQILPCFNTSEILELFKKQNFTSGKKILGYLTEISIHIDQRTNVINLISFLQTLPTSLTFNILGNLESAANYMELLSFLDNLPSLKNIIVSYTSIPLLQSNFTNNFSFSILVDFPIDMRQWNHSRQLLLDQNLPFEYVFEVSSIDDCQLVNELAEVSMIEKYREKPVYTGSNVDFFKENVFLTKQDILSASISINDIFLNQSINLYDFGKINIMPNGDIHANINYPVLGNIQTHSIHEIISKEVEEGKSWFRIRNQTPCNTCVYQWLCPPPSNYEIEINCPNLCLVE